MEGKWNVYYEDRLAGSCELVRQGLYYKILCRCDRVTDGICRLTLRCGDSAVDLGVLVPVGDGYGLERWVPVKHLPEGELRFCIRATERKRGDKFIPVRSDEPFAHLALLDCARFARREGEVG